MVWKYKSPDLLLKSNSCSTGEEHLPRAFLPSKALPTFESSSLGLFLKEPDVRQEQRTFHAQEMAITKVIKDTVDILWGKGRTLLWLRYEKSVIRNNIGLGLDWFVWSCQPLPCLPTALWALGQWLCRVHFSISGTNIFSYLIQTYQIWFFFPFRKLSSGYLNLLSYCPFSYLNIISPWYLRSTFNFHFII